MLNKTITIKLFFIGGLFFCFYNCIQTNTFSTNYQRLNQYKNPAYIGTFSSITVLKDEGDTSSTDWATAYINYRYDSIIKARVTKMRPVNMIGTMGNSVVKKLSSELVSIIQDVQIANNISYPLTRNYYTIDSISSTLTERYTSFFVSYGHLLAPPDFRNYKLGKALVNGIVVATTIVISVTIAALLGGKTGSTNLNVDNAKDKFNDGVFCYLIIYDKENRKVCFLRRQYFGSDKKNNQAFHPNKINKQINVIFKEYLRK